MDTKQFLKDLCAERDRINNAIAALEALNGTGLTQPTAKNAPAPAAVKTAKATPGVGKRVVSPEARQRMAEAQKKRYAKAKRAVKAAAKSAAVVGPVAKTSPIATGARKPMSAATKKKLAVAAKARWAAKKSATPTAKRVATA